MAEPMTKGDASMALYQPQAEAPQVLSTPQELDLLKDTIARDQGLSDKEFDLFVHICQHKRLDPFAKQIYAIRRKGKLTFQTSIDGFRVIADRTGRYAPGRATEFQYDDKGNLLSATAFVQKLVAGTWHEVGETAYWSEYYPGKREGFMWNKMPHVMLGKTSEAKTLRRAFPQDLSGLYTDEEMAQAGSDGSITDEDADFEVVEAPVEQLEPPKPQPTASLGALHARFKALGFEDEHKARRHALASAILGKEVMTFSRTTTEENGVVMKVLNWLDGRAKLDVLDFAGMVEAHSLKLNDREACQSAVATYIEYLSATADSEVGE